MKSNAWPVLYKAHWVYNAIHWDSFRCSWQKWKLNIFLTHVMLQHLWESPLLDTFILMNLSQYSSKRLRGSFFFFLHKVLYTGKPKIHSKKITGNVDIYNFQHLRFQRCSQSRNHLFFTMIWFYFFLDSFIPFHCQFIHFWWPCIIGVHTNHEECHLLVEKGHCKGIYQVYKSLRGELQDSHVFLFLSFFFQEFTDTQKETMVK